MRRFIILVFIFICCGCTVNTSRKQIDTSTNTSKKTYTLIANGREIKHLYWVSGHTGFITLKYENGKTIDVQGDALIIEE